MNPYPRLKHYRFNLALSDLGERLEHFWRAWISRSARPRRQGSGIVSLRMNEADIVAGRALADATGVKRIPLPVSHSTAAARLSIHSPMWLSCGSWTLGALLGSMAASGPLPP